MTDMREAGANSPGCASIRLQIDALVDDRLPARAARRVQGHLEHCSACRAELTALRALRAELATLPLEPLPEGLQASLARRLRVTAPAPPRRRWALACLPVGTALAGFLLAAVMASPALRTQGAEAPSNKAAVAAVLAPYRPPSVASSGAAASAAGTTPHSLNEPAAVAFADGTASKLGTPAPAALALTILVRDPAQAVPGLSALAAADGGHAVSTFLGSGGTGSGPLPVATLEAVVPASTAQEYPSKAAAYGTVLAAVQAPGASTGASPAPDVHLLITVLEQTSQPSSPAPRPSWSTRVLRGAARDWPWVGGAALLALAGGLLLGGRPRA